MLRRCTACMAAFVGWCSSTGFPPAQAHSLSARLLLDLGHTQQQVKSKIGEEQAPTLTEHTQFSSSMAALYGQKWFDQWFSVGLYGRWDAGYRKAARVTLQEGNEPSDSARQPQLQQTLGGHFHEFWLGPLVQAQFFQTIPLHLGVAHGTLALRQDAARDDLSNENGERKGHFATTPTVSWVFLSGFQVPVAALPGLSVMTQLEYRIRYYTTRGGAALVGSAVHGTQDVALLLGVHHSLFSNREEN